MNKISRDFEQLLERRLKNRLNFIQVVVGPRQVGKTTGVRSVLERYPGPKYFATADSPIPFSSDWLANQWRKARALGSGALLVIDEVQKVEGWAEVCKLLFDEFRDRRELSVVLLGSASLSIQQGLDSSLTGRFELIKVPHWSLSESRRAFGWDAGTFLRYGGYPAAAELVSDLSRWQTFVKDSIIEPVLGRDVSGLVRINKPALFRQTFRLAMQYPAQVISYQKMLGQLQDRGNAATIKHYLELFQAAFLIQLVEKYSGSALVTSSSSPKIIPLAPALSNALVESADKLDDPTWNGHLFEAAIGAALARKLGRLYYWTYGNHEVDFVREIDGEIIAYEVKSRLTSRARSLEAFKKRFPAAKIEIIELSDAESWL